MIWYDEDVLSEAQLIRARTAHDMQNYVDQNKAKSERIKYVPDVPPD